MAANRSLSLRTWLLLCTRHLREQLLRRSNVQTSVHWPKRKQADARVDIDATSKCNTNLQARWSHLKVTCWRWQQLIPANWTLTVGRWWRSQQQDWIVAVHPERHHPWQQSTFYHACDWTKHGREVDFASTNLPGSHIGTDGLVRSSWIMYDDTCRQGLHPDWCSRPHPRR